MANDSRIPKTVSRQEAIQRGLKRYFTGKRCKNGHIAERKTCDGGCLICVSNGKKRRRQIDPQGTRKKDADYRTQYGRERMAANEQRYRLNHPGRRYEITKRWLEKNPEYYRRKNREGAALHRQRYPERVEARRQDWNSRNQERRKATIQLWFVNNPRKRAFYSADYRAALNRPWWADQAAIEAFYRDCPPGMTVDHKIPLRGRNVCGLHIADNLQYMPMVENSRKGNKFIE
ncbi:MAG: hypothetical protein C5B60_02505 [Chloroflexi bacterium]|nr:MAG: hypothetical protein C5B60_02505 [Chloroflexota bacterium]